MSNAQSPYEAETLPYGVHPDHHRDDYPDDHPDHHPGYPEYPDTYRPAYEDRQKSEEPEEPEGSEGSDGSGGSDGSEGADASAPGSGSASREVKARLKLSKSLKSAAVDERIVAEWYPVQ